jgi:hypothetical protein
VLTEILPRRLDNAYLVLLVLMVVGLGLSLRSRAGLAPQP